MSKKRQTVILDHRGDPNFDLTTFTYDFPPHYFIPEHFHKEAQLLFATKGVMSLRVGQQTWMVPPQKAVWIPSNTKHSIQMSKAVSMRTVYLVPKLVRHMPKVSQTFHVSSLFRELILHCCTLDKMAVRKNTDAPLIRVLLQQIADAKSMPLSLPHPTDPRAVRVANIVLKTSGDPRTLRELSKEAGASKRTMERLFQTETGMSFGKWRQQVRLLHGIKLVAEGEKVTQAALEVGYQSPSAFISMFRKILGTTPGRYLSAETPGVSTTST